MIADSTIPVIRFPFINEGISFEVYQEFVKNSCTPAYCESTQNISLVKYPTEILNLQFLRSVCGLFAELEEYWEPLRVPGGVYAYGDTRVSIDDVISEAGDVLFWYTALTYYFPAHFPQIYSDGFNEALHEFSDTQDGRIVNLAEKYTRKNADKYLVALIAPVVNAVNAVIFDCASRLFMQCVVSAPYERPRDSTSLRDYVRLLRQTNYTKLTQAPRIRNIS